MQGVEKGLHYSRTQWQHFEKLLLTISSQFINLPVARIDSIIEDCQRRICETLGYDVSSLWQRTNKDRRIMLLTHLHTPPDGPQRPAAMDASKSFPWVYQQMLAGETLAYSTDQLPEQAAVDKESRNFYGIRSSVNIPLVIEGCPLIGILTFDTLRGHRNWTAEEVNRLKLVAEVFTSALVRRDAEKHLIESEKRLALAADSAGAGLWELDVRTGKVWVTDKARTIFGYDSSEDITLERLETSIHSSDLAPIREALARSFEDGEPLDLEYRIVTDDGSTKWVYSSGRPYFHADGGPDRLLGLSIDITDRKMRESEHIRNEELLASAIDIAALGFYEMVADARISFLDDRMLDLIGISLADKATARQFWLAHIHPEDLSFVNSIIQKVLIEGADRLALDYRYMHPQRGLTWIHHLSRVLERDAHGRATRIIGVMQDVTTGKLAEEKLRESRETLKGSQRDLQRLAGRLIAVKEEELRRLSRELHDDLSQRLAVLAIEAGRLELEMTGIKGGNPAYLEKIIQIKEQLIKVAKDVHRISRQLHPTILDDLGLVRAIESECEAIRQREELTVIFSSSHVPRLIPVDVSLCIYRIIQEGLNNIIHHSRVNRCEVDLRGTRDRLSLTISDEGMGFEPAEVRHKPGLGLSSMRERVLFVQGVFEIESRLGQGTKIRVSIPLNKEC